MEKNKGEPKKLKDEQLRVLRKEISKLKRKIEENDKKIVKDKGLIKREFIADAAKFIFIITFIFLFHFSQKD
jgi:hypothetical protein